MAAEERPLKLVLVLSLTPDTRFATIVYSLISVCPAVVIR